jgi:hypothetical protein
MTRLLFFLILYLLVSGCTENEKVLSLDEQVYEFVFNEIMQDASTEIFISNSYGYGIVSSKSIESLKETYDQLETFPEALLSELLDNSNVPGALNWQPIMVNASFLDAESDQSSPSSYHYISRVSLDKESMEAVVLFGYACPVLCGAHDTILHLRKYGVEWKIEGGVRLWIS